MNYDLFQKNTEVVKEKGSIPYWVIADRLGVHENTVRNWMKKEMTAEQRDGVLAAIKEIRKDLSEVS